MEVKVFFFGVLAEVTGTNFKYYSDVRSFGDLKLKIQDDFPEVVHHNFRVSVNNLLTDNDPLLNDGDEVELIPLFSGR